MKTVNNYIQFCQENSVNPPVSGAKIKDYNSYCNENLVTEAEEAFPVTETEPAETLANLPSTYALGLEEVKDKIEEQEEMESRIQAIRKGMVELKKMEKKNRKELKGDS